MDKVYEDAKDVHVSGIHIYVKTSDTYAYADNNYKTKIDAVDLKDLFLKGVYINDGGTIYKPVMFKMNSGSGELTYLKAGTSNAVTFATIYSKEYTAA